MIQNLNYWNIYDFQSLHDIINFKNSYKSLRKQLISKHEGFINEEKNLLEVELKELTSEIEILSKRTEARINEEINILKQQISFLEKEFSAITIKKIFRYFKIWNYKRKIKKKERSFKSEIKKSIFELNNQYCKKIHRYEFLSSQFEVAVLQSADKYISELDRKYNALKNLRNFYYGALGEQKVVDALIDLSDDYFLINDFSIIFSPALYRRNENDYIKSVQIDHLLIGPSGIFLIETKHWKQSSIEENRRWSPLNQIKRSNYAMFRLIENDRSRYYLRLDKFHWGDRKIPIRNLLAWTNKKPIQEFPFVKSVSVSQLHGYVKYFKPIFSVEETHRIAEYLVAINKQKSIRL